MCSTGLLLYCSEFHCKVSRDGQTIYISPLDLLFYFLDMHFFYIYILSECSLGGQRANGDLHFQREGLRHLVFEHGVLHI